MAAVDGKLVSIYLNDHLAAITAGIEVAGRSAGSNEGTPLGAFLAEVRGALDAERAVLIEVLDRLGTRRDRVKETAGWAAEKFGRLKMNGRIRSYSPLSRVTELEALLLCTDATAAMWWTLEDLLGGDPEHREIDFAARAGGMEALRDRIEGERRPAAAASLGAE
ncbi:MAG TPA: hypothetical protein VKA89_01295 [Solirubrobacterales bacterium]|nr:hypothetical protein [Solirubrobacterales bacterium]